jgi:hypothetical protein
MALPEIAKRADAVLVVVPAVAGQKYLRRATRALAEAKRRACSPRSRGVVWESHQLPHAIRAPQRAPFAARARSVRAARDRALSSRRCGLRRVVGKASRSNGGDELACSVGEVGDGDGDVGIRSLHRRCGSRVRSARRYSRGRRRGRGAPQTGARSNRDPTSSRGEVGNGPPCAAVGIDTRTQREPRK